MIMAGRGRRLGDIADQPKKVGLPATSPSDFPIDMPTLVAKINEINVSEVDPTALNSIQSLFKQLCVSKTILKDVLSNLHSKALCDAHFGEKFIVAIEQVSHLEIDGALVRDELLSFIQEDFKEKDTLSQSDSKKFVNAVVLLGCVYNRIKVCGKPISVLGVAFMEYFDLLLKGEEDELKALTKQIISNESILLESKELVQKYDLLKYNLRNALISRNLTSLTRCWILLALDFMSGSQRPLTGAIRDFYIANLGDDYTKLESLMEVKNTQLNNSFSSPESLKSQDSGFVKHKKPDKSLNKADGTKKNFSKAFSDMSLKSEPGSFKGKKEKVVSPQNKNPKRDNWKWSNNERANTRGSSSGHDDRFEKEENFYGVQMPRRPKPENQKKIVTDGKTNKESNDTPQSPTGLDVRKEIETGQESAATGEGWD